MLDPFAVRADVASPAALGRSVRLLRPRALFKPRFYFIAKHYYHSRHVVVFGLPLDSNNDTAMALQSLDARWVIYKKGVSNDVH